MARTRGASIIAEGLRGDEPMTFEDTGLQDTLTIALDGDSDEIEEELHPPPIYICNPSTLDRNMEASELAEILAMVLGGWSLEVPAEKWTNLRPDVRRHFKRTV